MSNNHNFSPKRPKQKRKGLRGNRKAPRCLERRIEGKNEAQQPLTQITSIGNIILEAVKRIVVLIPLIASARKEIKTLKKIPQDSSGEVNVDYEKIGS